MSSAPTAQRSDDDTYESDQEGSQSWIWSVLLLAFCHAQAIASLHIVNILVDPIRQTLAISDTQYSVLQGAALVVLAVLLGLPVARIADRRSRRNVIVFGAVVWSTGSLLSACAQSFSHLVAARALVGIGEIVLFPAALSMIYDLSPRHRLATSIGLFGSGGPIGAALAMIGGGWLISASDDQGLVNYGFGEAEAWRIAFALCGLMGILAAFGMLTIAEPTRGATRDTASKEAPLLEHLRHAWPVYLCVSGGFVLLSTAVFAVNAWTPTYLVRVREFSYEAAGQFTGAAAIGCAVAGAWLAGVSVDWLQRQGRRDAAILVSVGTAAVLAVCVAGAILASALTWSIILLCATYFLLGMPTVLGGTALQQVSPAHLRAQIMALHVLFVNLIALSIGPMGVAVLTDYFFREATSVGYSIALSVAFSATLAAVALWAARRSFTAIRTS